MIRFENSTILEGQRLAEHLLRDCHKETPPAAVIGLGMCLVTAAHTAGVKRNMLIELLDVFYDDLHGAVKAEDALSNLVLPGR